MHNESIRSYGVIFPEIKEHGYEKSGIPVHEAPQPPLIYSQRSFEGQGHIEERRTIATMDISKSIHIFILRTQYGDLTLSTPMTICDPIK